MDTQKTGDYLAALRKAKGLTQQEIADRLGVSNKTISLLLLLAGAVLAFWVGWGPCGKARLRGRLYMLLSLAAVMVYLLLWRFAPWGALGDLLRKWVTWKYFDLFLWAKSRLAWTLWLLLLPLLYALLRWTNLRWNGGDRLMDRRPFQVLTAGWAASLTVDIARWAVEGGKFRAYMEALPEERIGQDGISSSLLESADEVFQELSQAIGTGRQTARAVIVLTLLALAVLWLKRHVPAKTED